MINSLSRWEQAFCIFSNIHVRAFPHRSTELIEYNHVIHTIAGMYVWDNVYNYNKEFRIHLAKHPSHSWSVILQQAWSMKLKDHINYCNDHNSHNTGSGGNFKYQENKHKQGNGESCLRY